jgi:hypothetical protein
MTNRYINRTNQPMTISDIQQYAPSALSTVPHASRSEQFTFVAVIEALMDSGFQPFSAAQSRTRDESRREFTKHMLRFRKVIAPLICHSHQRLMSTLRWS